MTVEDYRFSSQHRHPQGQRQRLMARVLLRAMLARYYPSSANSWKILRDVDGAPRLSTDGPKASLPFVSLSHSGNLVACAISGDAAVGVDIERIRSDRQVVALADTAFGPLETAAVQAAGDAAFYRIWTLREALAKASGGGFGLLMNGKDLVPFSAGTQMAHRSIDGKNWDFAYWQLPEQYSLGLVYQTNSIDRGVPSPLCFSGS